MAQQPADIISQRVIDKLNRDMPTSVSSSPTTNSGSTYVDVDKIIADTLESVTADARLIMEGGTPAYTERPNPTNDLNTSLVNAINEKEYNKRNNDTTYFATAQDRCPATPQQAQTVGVESRQATKSTQRKADAVRNPKTDKQSNAENVGVPYKFSSVDANGNKVNFTAKLTRGNFKLNPNDLERDNIPKNINTIKKYITRMIYESVGGWDRVNTIKVKTGYLMVNNMLITPQSQFTFDKNTLPLDVYDYLGEGAIAYLFNWNMLTKMYNLLSIDIDTVDFYLSEICADLGYGRTGGYKTIFYEIESLNVLKIGDNVLTREEVFAPKENNQGNINNISEQLSYEKRGLNIMDGYTVNIYSNTNAFEGWTWGNLRNYAKNRGNKGIFRFGVGCTMRFLLGASSSVLNAGAHLVGGTFKFLKQAIKDGMTPISDNN